MTATQIGQNYTSFANRSGVAGRNNQLVTGGNYKTPIVSHGNRVYVVHVAAPMDQGPDKGPEDRFSGGSNAPGWLRIFDRNTGKEVAAKIVTHVVNDWNLAPWGLGFQYDTTHHGFAIAVDKRGYLWMLGRMHRTPQQWTVPPGHKYADEYRHAWQIWRSDAPLSPNQSTSPVMEFAGQRVRVGDRVDTRKAPPGVMISYADFFMDMEGELYVKSRVSIGPSGYDTAIGVSRYDVASETWSPIGDTNHSFGNTNHAHARWGVPRQYYETVEDTPNISSPRALVWNESGAEVPQAKTYQGGFLALHADVSGRINLAAAIAAGHTVRPVGNRPVAAYVLYAYSDDQMRTWRRTDGSQVTRLPMTATGHPDSIPDIAVGPDWFNSGQKSEFWNTVGTTHLGFGSNEWPGGAPFLTLAKAGGGKNWIACYDPEQERWRDPIEIKLRGNNSVTSTQCYVQCDNTGHLILPWSNGTFYRGTVKLNAKTVDWSTMLNVPGLNGFPDRVDPIELRRTGDIFVRSEHHTGHKVFHIKQGLRDYPVFGGTPKTYDTVTIQITDE